MTSTDLFLLLPITFAIIRGYRKGIIIEVFSFIALIIALIASMKLTSKLLHILEGSFHSSVLPFICYAIVFIGVFILIIKLGGAFDKAAELMMLGTINRIIGSLFSLAKVLFMISLFFWLGDKAMVISGSFRAHSFFYSHIHGFAPYIINMVTPLLPFMKGLLGNIEDFFTSISK